MCGIQAMTDSLRDRRFGFFVMRMDIKNKKQQILAVQEIGLIIINMLTVGAELSPTNNRAFLAPKKTKHRGINP